MQTALRVCSLLVLAAVTIVPAAAQDFPPLDDSFGGGDFGGGGGGINAQFSAEYSLVRGTNKGEISVTVTIEPGHYVYSLDQVGGPGPTKIALVESDDAKLTGEFRSDTDPEVIEQDPIFEVRVEKHHDKVVFTAPLELTNSDSPESKKIGLIYDGQVCSKNGCQLVEGKELKASFAGYTEPPSEPGTYRPEYSHVTWKGYVEPKVAAPGDTVRIVLTALPDTSYHVYGFAPSIDKNAEKAGASPTMIALTKRNNWPADLPRPSVEPKEHEVIDGAVSYWHDEPVSWSIELQVPRGTSVGEYDLAGLLAFQTCEEQVCELPDSAAFSAKIKVGEKAELGQVPLQFAATPKSYVEVSKIAADSTWGGALSSEFGDKPIALILGFAFFAGLILNVMPCVLPVIGLKIMSFVDQAGSKRMNVIKLNLWFSAGLVFVFLILATLGAVFGLGWGEHFQSVTFTVALITIVFTFALSFLGVWEIPIPGFVGSGKAQKLSTKEGAIGAFSKGVLTTVLATPCTGPFLVPVISWSLTQPVWLTYSLFVTVGLGMASPYLLIGAFPSLINLLPRPGAWMETFKQLMGFVLMGTVVFLFSSLSKDLVVPTLTLLVGIAVACWWIGRVPLSAPAPKRMANWLFASAWSIGIAAFAFLFLGGGIELNWEPYDRVALESHVEEGNTVMVDFTADWCGTCKANEKFALNTWKTKRFMETNGIVAMKADKTRTSPEIDKLLVELGNPTKGIPFLAIFPGDGGPPIIQDGILTQGKVLELLEQAGPSQLEEEAAGSEGQEVALSN